MKLPQVDDIATAVEWLLCNEGDDGEAESCRRVADWLVIYARASVERAAAKQVGCSVDRFRQVMAERGAHSAEPKL